MSCNFNCLFDNKGLFFKVTGSHVHCTCGGVSETVQKVETLLLHRPTTMLRDDAAIGRWTCDLQVAGSIFSRSTFT